MFQRQFNTPSHILTSPITPFFVLSLYPAQLSVALSLFKAIYLLIYFLSHPEGMMPACPFSSNWTSLSSIFYHSARDKLWNFILHFSRMFDNWNNLRSGKTIIIVYEKARLWFIACAQTLINESWCACMNIILFAVFLSSRFIHELQADCLFNFDLAKASTQHFSPREQGLVEGCHVVRMVRESEITISCHPRAIYHCVPDASIVKHKSSVVAALLIFQSINKKGCFV